MTNWHDEIVAAVQMDFKAAEEAVKRKRKRREAVIDFWRRTVDALKANCTAVNRLLGKQMFTLLIVDQDNNNVCSIEYSGPTKRLAGVSIDPTFTRIEITIPNRSQKFTFQPGDDNAAVAVHESGERFAPIELVEEILRGIMEVESRRNFKKPSRKISFEDELRTELREW